MQHPQGDLLAAVIEPLRVESAFVSLWKMGGEWSIAGPPESCALFHYNAHGTLRIETAHSEPILLNPGDLVLFPHGTAHHLGNSSTATPEPLEKILPRRRQGEFLKIEVPGGHRSSEILCAGLRYAGHSVAAALYRLFPEAIVIRDHQIRNEPLLQGTLQGLLSEVERLQEDKRFILRRGLELIYILGLRMALDVNSTALSEDHVLRDRRIANALLYMHTRYQERSSVAQMASAAGMSRSAFSESFRRATGSSPASYRSLIRVSEAQRLLKTTKLTREEIAHRVGFESTVGLYLALRSVERAEASNRALARTSDSGSALL